MDGRNSSAQSIALPELHMPDFKEEVPKRVTGVAMSPTREAEIVEELSRAPRRSIRTIATVTVQLKRKHTGPAALTGLAESDLLARELKRVERRVQHDTLALGKERTNFWAISRRTSATGCACCSRTQLLPLSPSLPLPGNWREYRNF